MIAVAFETSGRPASVALNKDGESFEEVLTEGRAHASNLLPALERLMERAHVEHAAIDVVFVGTGPGSYTGLRVGIATALGIARGADAKILGIPSGESRTFAECEVGSEASLLLDARQGELYFAHYKRTQDGVETLHAPCVTTTAELDDRLPTSGILLGDATVAKAAELSSDRVERLRIADESEGYPRAGALLELGLSRLGAGESASMSAPEPLYLRPFAAKPRSK